MKTKLLYLFFLICFIPVHSQDYEVVTKAIDNCIDCCNPYQNDIDGIGDNYKHQHKKTLNLSLQKTLQFLTQTHKTEQIRRKKLFYRLEC